MAKTHRPYAPEFRRQMVELVRAGRDSADLAREFEPSSQAIRNWVAQADRQDGRREAKPAADAGLSTAEREELSRLRRDNKQLRLERDILSRATAWFARRARHDPVRLFGFMSATRPALFRSPRWHACSACRRPATMPGAIVRPRRAP